MIINLVAHNIRSYHNVGSLARTADGFGVSQIWCTGYTPFLTSDSDDRPPHVRRKTASELHKTALGAEQTVNLVGGNDVMQLMADLKKQGFRLLAIEQSPESIPLETAPKSEKVALILGNEIDGLPDSILEICDAILEIPMLGKKESYNVAISGALAMYELRRAQ